MSISRKNLFVIAMALSFNAAHGQTVSIDGGNIRVDASPSQKASVNITGNTKNKTSNRNTTGKNSKSVVSAEGSGSVAVIEGKQGAASHVGSEQNMRGERKSASRSGKVFVNAEISGQNHSRASYSGASLTNVEAVGTNFREADLTNAIMTNVDLSNADLRGARLTGAQTTNVDWDGALLDGAIWMDGRRCGTASVGKCM